MAEVISSPIQLSESAAAALVELRANEGIAAEKMLRVGVKGGGCSGLTYVLDFDEKKDFDEVYEIKGLKVIVDQRHAMYVFGMEVDYESGLNDRGFVFKNPNAKDTCGCGTSFST